MRSSEMGSILLEGRAQVRTLTRESFTSIGVVDSCCGMGAVLVFMFGGGGE